MAQVSFESAFYRPNCWVGLLLASCGTFRGSRCQKTRVFFFLMLFLLSLTHISDFTGRFLFRERIIVWLLFEKIKNWLWKLFRTRPVYERKDMWCKSSSFYEGSVTKWDIWRVENKSSLFNVGSKTRIIPIPK